MLTRKRIVSTGIAALLGIGVLVMPSLAGAQSYRYRSNTSAENSSRNNALLLGAAGLLLSANHQSTLGTIALGGAAYEAYQMQQQINKRHQTYGYYGRDGRWQTGDYQYGNRNNYNYNGYSNAPNDYNYNGYSNVPSDGYYDSYGAWHSTSNVWNSGSSRDRDQRDRYSRNRSSKNRQDRDRDGD
jgi:hypothetical protein